MGVSRTYALSIDVGTTYTAAATWRDGRATTVTLGDHSDAVPSVLFLREDDVFLVGDAAERRAISDPSRVAREFKRRMGDAVPKILAGQTYSATTLTAYMIGWVVDRVAEREGGPPDHVALTCPASWGEHRRSALTTAANRAGMDTTGRSTLGLMTEPEAAASHYAARHRLLTGTAVAVYDFGGGTFDAAVVRKTADGFELCGAARGNDSIGGVDIDAIVLQLITGQIGNLLTTDDDDPLQRAALAQLRSAAVLAKEALSADPVCDVPVILPLGNRLVQISRAEVEDRIRPLVADTIRTLRLTIGESGLASSELAGVLLVGGSSRIPLVSQLVSSELGLPILKDAHPKHAVCLGAAMAVATRVQPTIGRTVPAAVPVLPSPATPAPILPAEQVTVDLAAAGLTTPQDTWVRLQPRASERLPVIDRDEPLIARLDETAPDRGMRRRLVILVLAAVLLVVAVVLLAQLH